jgi:hypothetical protein
MFWLHHGCTLQVREEHVEHSDGLHYLVYADHHSAQIYTRQHKASAHWTWKRQQYSHHINPS